MSDICFEGLKILVMVAVLVLTRYVLPWVKSKADSEKLNLVAQWAYKAVLMAQQTMKATGGKEKKALGIDIGSTTVKVALLDQDLQIIFSDYERHYANIQETLAGLLKKALNQTGPIDIIPVITGSGGLTLSSHLHVPFVQ